MHDAPITDLEDWITTRDGWRELEAAYTSLLARLEEGVRRQVLAPSDADWELLRPLVGARNGRPPRRALVAPPNDWGDVVEYGYDAGRRIVLARRFRSLLDGHRYVRDERVLTDWHGQSLQLFVFNDQGRPRLDLVVVPEVRDGWLVKTTSWHRPERRETPRIETYEYDERGQLAVVRAGRDVHRFSYQVDGAVAEVRFHLDGADEPVIVYEASAGTQVRAARRAIEQNLPERIRAWAARHSPAGPAYAIAMSYDPSDITGGPSLALGTVEQLRSWLDAERPDTLWSVALNPAEFRVFDTDPIEIVEDRTLVDAFRVLAQEWASGDDLDRLRKVLVNAAKHTGRMDLAIDAGPLPGPAVFVVDLELEDLNENFNASVPAKIRRALHTQLGLSPPSTDR